LLSNGSLDINIHDTYFVISDYSLAEIFAILFIIIGLIHWFISKKEKVSFLNKWHIYISIGCVLLYFVVKIFFKYFYKPNQFPLFDDLNNELLINTILLALFIFTQIISLLIFLINIIKNGIQRATSKQN